MAIFAFYPVEAPDSVAWPNRTRSNAMLSA